MLETFPTDGHCVNSISVASALLNPVIAVDGGVGVGGSAILAELTKAPIFWNGMAGAANACAPNTRKETRTGNEEYIAEVRTTRVGMLMVRCDHHRPLARLTKINVLGYRVQITDRTSNQLSEKIVVRGSRVQLVKSKEEGRVAITSSSYILMSIYVICLLDGMAGRFRMT